MTAGHLALILLPTLKCNAACDYCFEHKTSAYLSLEKLRILIDKVLDYMDAKALGALTIYWQGGEAMLLAPGWYEQAYDLIAEAAAGRTIQVRHCLQSNLLAYSRKWNPLIARMFDNCIGTSLDYPNLHRKLPAKSPAHYDALWLRKMREARMAGIKIEVISLPNRASLELGAERFYSYFVDELQLTDFQINTPFPGGTLNSTKQEPGAIDSERLLRFHLDLLAVWLERGYARGVKIGPFDALIDYFSHRHAVLPCIWGDNCVDRLIAIDARGYVAQCDCWVSSYPAYRFGTIFSAQSLIELLQASTARRQFIERPMQLVQRECIDCDYLPLCHGGCPIRAYSFHGTLVATDPYCELYKGLFKQLENSAVKLARQAVERSPS